MSLSKPENRAKIDTLVQANLLHEDQVSAIIANLEVQEICKDPTMQELVASIGTEDEMENLELLQDSTFVEKLKKIVCAGVLSKQQVLSTQDPYLKAIITDGLAKKQMDEFYMKVTYPSYIYTYIHTYIQTNRQTDRQTYSTYYSTLMPLF